MKEQNPMKEQKEKEIMAVDVVIITSQEVSQYAISLSEQLEKSSPIVLNQKDYLPHISLSMNYIDDVMTTKQIIEQVVSQVEPLLITVKSISRGVKPFEGHYFYGLSIEKNESLKKLHNSLVDTMPNVPVEKPVSKYFLPESNGAIVQAVYDYVGSFKTHHSKDNFHPHITLGAGPADQLKADHLPLQFTVDTIYLCQLGNFCTCRKIIAEFPLGRKR